MADYSIFILLTVIQIIKTQCDAAPSPASNSSPISNAISSLGPLNAPNSLNGALIGSIGSLSGPIGPSSGPIALINGPIGPLNPGVPLGPFSGSSFSIGPNSPIGPLNPAKGSVPITPLSSYGLPNGASGAFGLPSSGPNLGGPYGYNQFGSAPQNGNANQYGGSGSGNVLVSGELPVGGATNVFGNVPITGAVEFGGTIPAKGAVTISGTCSCGTQYKY